MKIRNDGWIIFTLLVIIGLCIGYIVKNQTEIVTEVSNFKPGVTSVSKAAIVKQMSQLAAQVVRLEKNAGIPGKGGFIVYSPRTTSRLLSLYHALDQRLSYLNSGKLPQNPEQWDGYLLVKSNAPPYSAAQATKVMAELEENGVPANLVKQFHIFLLPSSIPGVGGLGGAGFTLISAPPDSGDSSSGAEAELAVTLYHETGHHIHMSFMPKATVRGEKYWHEYLVLRGGVWRGPGAVNTVAWSNSSEETFAEDFRMLFGKDQPYFGDVTLGDPRTNPEEAAKLKNFMIGLGRKQPMEKYNSPWIPAGITLSFWKHQASLLTIMWMGLISLGLITNLKSVSFSKLDSANL